MSSDKTAGVIEEGTRLSDSSIAALACLFGFLFIVLTLSIVCFLLRTRQVRNRRNKRVGFTRETETKTDVTIPTMVVDNANNDNKNRKVGESLRRYTDWYTHRGQKTEEPVTVTKQDWYTHRGQKTEEPVTVTKQAETRQAEMQQQVHVTGNQADMNYHVFKLPTSKGIFSQKHKKPTTFVISKQVRSPSAPPVIHTDKQGVLYTNSHYLGGRPHTRIIHQPPVKTYNLQQAIQPAPVVQTQRTHVQTPRVAPQKQQVVHIVRSPTQEQTVPRPVHHKPSNPVYHVQYVPQEIQYSHNDVPNSARSSTYSNVHVHGSRAIQNSPRQPPPSPGPVYEYGGFSHQRVSQYRPRVLSSPGYSPNYSPTHTQRSTHGWRLANASNGEDAWISHDADNKAQTVFFGDDDMTGAKIEVEETYPSDITNDVYTASYQRHESTESVEKIIDFVDPEPNQNSIPPLSLSTPRFDEQEVTMSLDAFLGNHDTHSNSHTSSLSDDSESGRRRGSRDDSDK